MNQARRRKLGQKWVCFACSGKFYDLGKPEPICPKCGKDQRDSPVFDPPKRRKVKAPEKAIAVPLDPAPAQEVARAPIQAADGAPDAEADLETDLGVLDLEEDDLTLESEEEEEEEAEESSLL
jgi:hypothetical protein